MVIWRGRALAGQVVRPAEFADRQFEFGPPAPAPGGGIRQAEGDAIVSGAVDQDGGARGSRDEAPGMHRFRQGGGAEEFSRDDR